jgi:predicted Zn finger-like uncharacterized protein
MIIQCRKCETRFRFDDKLIEGDGVWVRCSRCQNVFFEARPAGDILSSVPADPEIPTVRISDAKRVPNDRFPLGEERIPRVERDVEREKGEILPPGPAEMERDDDNEIGQEPAIDMIDAGMDKDTLRIPLTAEDDDEEDETEVLENEPGRRRWGWAILKVITLLIFTIVVTAGVSLWLLPEIRTQTLEWVSPQLREILGAERLLGKETKKIDTAAAPVRIKEVRQRSVTNLLVGTLRVIEGVAVNQSSYPLAKIRVRLVISDAYDVVLGEKIVACGNILSDAELNTLAEAEIQRELITPRGTDVSNQRIEPNGEIPFMIVFSQEQAGAIKTVVTPAGADRAP